MKRILLFMVATVAGATLTLAQDPPDQPKSKKDKPPLTEEQRAQMEQRLNDAWTALPAESKMRLMRLHRALSEMPPNESRFIHERIERFLNMTPEERQKLRENAERWKNMTPEERQKAREDFRKRRQEFEEKWRRDHPGEEPPQSPPHKPDRPHPVEGENAPQLPPPPSDQ
jgi:hypothetical protein